MKYFQEVDRRSSKSGEKHLHLFLLGTRRKKWSTCVDFEDEAAKTPDVDLAIIRFHQDNLRRSIIPTLYVSELLAISEASRSKVNKFYS